MGKKKLESIQQKKKEKLDRKAKEKKEEEVVEEKSKEEKEKPKKKVEIKKPKVSEAKGRGEYLPISSKISVEVCRAIRGKNVEKAKNILKGAIEKKKPIRYFRYKKDTPHRKGKGFGAGRFPVKVSKYILGVLENAIANAKYLELDPDELYVKRSISNRAVSKESQRGRYTNLEIVVAKKTKKVKK